MATVAGADHHSRTLLCMAYQNSESPPVADIELAWVEKHTDSASAGKEGMVLNRFSYAGCQLV